MNNDKKSFLATFSQGNIYCPACGNFMSMRNFDSYQLVFTTPARQILNTMVSQYVNYLIFFDDALSIHDQYGLENIPTEIIPYDTASETDKFGIYTTVYADGLRIVCKSRETLAKLKKIGKLPKTIDVVDKNQADRYFSLCEKTIIGQLSPYNYLGKLINITNQQYAVRSSICKRSKISKEQYENLKPDNVLKAKFTTDIGSALADWSKMVDNLVHIAPGYSRYLGYMIKLAEVSGDGKKLESLEKDIMITLHILNLFLCGSYLEYEKDPQSFTEKESKIKPFQFGLNSIVRDWETVGDIITSDNFLLYFEKYWPETFLNKVKGKEPWVSKNDQEFKNLLGSEEPGSPKNIESLNNLVEEIGEKHFTSVLSSVVDFACAGKKMTMPDYTIKTKVFGKTEANLKDLAKNWISNSICGWYPGERTARSLVLIGGTGSGKSSIAQSGIVTLSSALCQFGYNLSFPGPIDEVIFDFYHNNHSKGVMPDATEEGARYTLTLGLHKIDQLEDRTDLIFTDIAGEKIEAALLGGTEDPVVLGALRSADTFVYLFDLLAWKDFALTILEAGTNVGDYWDKFIKQRENLNAKSRAVRDSFAMLKNFVEKIHQIRKTSNEKNPYDLAKKCTFILVFPKADLYWQDNDGFLSRFKTELSEKIFFKNLSSKEENILSSCGVTLDGYKKLNTDKPEDNNVKDKNKLNPSDILEVATIISNRTIEEINFSFPNIFGSPQSIQKETLPNVMERGIFDYLKTKFGPVYFLPVSAQGKESPKNDNNGNKGADLGSPAAQALCEFIFLIAAASTLDEYNPKNESPINSDNVTDIPQAGSN